MIDNINLMNFNWSWFSPIHLNGVKDKIQEKQIKIGFIVPPWSSCIIKIDPRWSVHQFHQLHFVGRMLLLDWCCLNSVSRILLME